MQFNFKQQDKSSYIQNLFNSIAQKYDWMNDLMTFGLHRLWKAELIRELNLSSGDKVLDLCCGTGDVALLAAKKFPQAEIFAVDFSEEMLKLARRKSDLSNLKFIQGDAMSLPFSNDTFKAVFISFGLRNVSDYELCLKEINRVCCAGAKLSILDMSHPKGFFDLLSGFYRFTIVPLFGKLFAKDNDAYNYLPNSIYQYPDQERLSKLMEQTGWKDVSFKNLFGGVIAFHRGVKQT
jgi:demethylmenaquinone methyltransferase/2-methoxy-6-polyprenyl-1,4-benzoquinol methylase